MIFYFLAQSTANPVRETKTKSELAQILNTQSATINSQICYLIDFHHKPSPSVLNQIASLTGSHTFAPSSELDFTQQILNLPRFGTQSPFSSKAHDILKISGFEIKQIEQGTLWSFSDSHLSEQKNNNDIRSQIEALITDPMTHQLLWSNHIDEFFQQKPKTSFAIIEILKSGKNALWQFNQKMGLGLSALDVDYLVSAYEQMGKNPTDAELMMFAAVNSEHCRHKIFNAKFVIDGIEQPHSLFEMIKQTSKNAPQNLITAYSDNSSVIKGNSVDYFHRLPDGKYENTLENQALLMKVETHNHPTVISPFAGAATGSGGEIRDEGATGRGGKTLAGLTGFSVSNLHLPNAPQRIERQKNMTANYPDHMASSLEIMIEGPIGAASFNNEFGRPNLTGYFRSFEYLDRQSKRWGYHKPIMIAGGMGQIIEPNFKKIPIKSGALVIVLGPPALKIGIGGGSASSGSLDSKKDSELDFSSVQRDNPEAQRRAAEVINHCIDLKNNNPILSIHDVGAGGLSNAIPELINDNQLGADLDFNRIAINDNSMNPLEIWCNESQERYVLAIAEESLALFTRICQKERCPFQVLGKTNDSKRLTLNDSHFNNKPVDLHLDWLFAKTQPLIIHDHLPTTNTKVQSESGLDWEQWDLNEAVLDVLSHPSVGSKAFLIHIGDRSVGGKTFQDQMVGAFQVPVADCAVCYDDFSHHSGSAMAMGERPALALLDSGLSVKIATTEAILNLAGADLNWETIALSANWMADCSDKHNQDPNNHENAKLYQAVQSLSSFCQELSIPIPVGKDSLSMKMIWQKQGKSFDVTAPVSLNVSAFTKVSEVNHTLTPELKALDETTALVQISLANPSLVGSILLQTQNCIGLDLPLPDIQGNDLQKFIRAFNQVKKNNWVLAYHDISDGGLLAAAVEMQFTTRQSIEINLKAKNKQQLFTELFSEMPAALLQVRTCDVEALKVTFANCELKAEVIATVRAKSSNQAKPTKETLSIFNHKQLIYSNSRSELEKAWSKVSFEIKKLRDNPDSVAEEFQQIEKEDTKLFLKTTFDTNNLGQIAQGKYLKNRPKVAIIREQGINGHVELAYNFHRAGFESVDVHMSELIEGTRNLKQFDGAAFPGGFSYGDTFGAATGWASSILFNPKLKAEFESFFHRPNSFGVGFCNGCQVLAKLKMMIPGAEYWPSFNHNTSSRFEARVVMVKVESSPSLFLNGMADSCIPIVVSHGEGRALFANDDYGNAMLNQQIALRYINSDQSHASQYPMNPNGSIEAVAGLTNSDGRFTIMMPHPERTPRARQLPIWTFDSEFSPWFKMFENARKFLD